MNQLFGQPCQCLDFPVSWDFFRAHCWEVHGYDPGPDRITEQVSPLADEPVPVNHLQKQIDQARSGFIHFQKVFNEHIDASKKAAKKWEEKKTKSKPIQGV